MHEFCACGKRFALPPLYLSSVAPDVTEHLNPVRILLLSLSLYLTFISSLALSLEHYLMSRKEGVHSFFACCLSLEEFDSWARK
ncbi:uncharacterized protein BDV14DRAFT_138308 [Aspergillus stella-maris]|uniref:uncharacterized protein n=1 Tax=Aspergillus stella-maris TaxID=1810926 RepID=UPI003CCD33C7